MEKIKDVHFALPVRMQDHSHENFVTDEKYKIDFDKKLGLFEFSKNGSNIVKCVPMANAKYWTKEIVAE